LCVFEKKIKAYKIKKEEESKKGGRPKEVQFLKVYVTRILELHCAKRHLCFGTIQEATDP
jgi:hypothetical protein